MEDYVSNELVVVEQPPQRGGMLDLASAANNLNALKIRHNIMVQATKEVLQDNVDFGKIPGTGNKPTLLKPGAEKLCFLFQLSPTFDLIDSIEDWDNGLFYYRYRCTLRTRDGLVIANAEGSCNSRETKYRYRNAKPKCPSCGAEAISRSKYPPRNSPNAKPGWWCRECKTDYAYTDPQIVGQDTGKVENSEPFELVNTLQKMAQKRAHVAATLIGTGASQFFTQDMEDLTIDAQATHVEAPKVQRQPQPRQHSAPPKPQEQEDDAEEAKTAEGETQRTVEEHWIDRASVRSKFWAFTKNQLNLTNDQVHTALNVEHIRDYEGSMEQAKAALETFAASIHEDQAPFEQ